MKKLFCSNLPPCYKLCLIQFTYCSLALVPACLSVCLSIYVWLSTFTHLEYPEYMIFVHLIFRNRKQSWMWAKDFRQHIMTLLCCKIVCPRYKEAKMHFLQNNLNPGTYNWHTALHPSRRCTGSPDHIRVLYLCNIHSHKKTSLGHMTPHTLHRLKEKRWFRSAY